MDRDAAPISLETRMFFVLVAYFAGLWLIAALVGTILDVGSFWVYGLAALVFLTLQTLAAPSLLERRLQVTWSGEVADPRLTAAVERAAFAADVPAPRIGISSLRMFNAFAFGRTRRDSRICITRPLLEVLTDRELDAVVAHEVCHIKSFDVTILSLLSVVPVASHAILELPQVLSASSGALVARVFFRILALWVSPLVWLVWLLMLPVNLLSTFLMNYSSRVREFSADLHTVEMGFEPAPLASALFKIGMAPADATDVRRARASRALMLEPRAANLEELVFLNHFDSDKSGDISAVELAAISGESYAISFADRVKEVFSSHPLAQKRFKRLSEM